MRDPRGASHIRPVSLFSSSPVPNIIPVLSTARRDFPFTTAMIRERALVQGRTRSRLVSCSMSLNSHLDKHQRTDRLEKIDGWLVASVLPPGYLDGPILDPLDPAHLNGLAVGRLQNIPRPHPLSVNHIFARGRDDVHLWPSSSKIWRPCGAWQIILAGQTRGPVAQSKQFWKTILAILEDMLPAQAGVIIEWWMQLPPHPHPLGLHGCQKLDST